MLKKIGAAIAGVAVLAAAVLAVVTLIASPSGVDADFRKQQGVKASVFAPRPKASEAASPLPEAIPTPEETTASDITALDPTESSPTPAAPVDLVTPVPETAAPVEAPTL